MNILRRNPNKPVQVDFLRSPRLDGVFWLDPTVIDRVNGIINQTSLSTMALAAITMSNKLVAERDGLSAELIDPEDPHSKDLNQAIDVGIAYGSLLSQLEKESKPTADTPPVDPGAHTAALLRHIRDHMPLTGEDQQAYGRRLFRSLRTAEVDVARSDMLAHCLSLSQDHMGTIFYKRDEQLVADGRLPEVQSMFYAGALLGAIGTRVEAMPERTVQIGANAVTDAVSSLATIEMEPGDKVADVVEYGLSHQCHIVPVGTHRNFAFRAVPGSVQFGRTSIAYRCHNPDWLMMIRLLLAQTLFAV